MWNARERASERASAVQTGVRQQEDNSLITGMTKAMRTRQYRCAVALLLFVAMASALMTTNARAADPQITWNAESGQARLTTGNVELLIDTKGGLNPHSLKNVQSGEVFADRDYCWPNGKLPALSKAPTIGKEPGGSVSITFAAKLEVIEVEQSFTAPAGEPGAILESITIRNPTDAPIATADFKCGFAKCIRQREAFTKDADDVTFSPIPYRRETDAKTQIFPLREIAAHGMGYTGWMEPVVPTPIWGAEGWVWSKGNTSFLIAKYNPDSMEWSLMEPVKQGAETCVRFGGAGQWKHGSPEYSSRLEAGKSYRFGETRLQSIEGDWKQAFYAFRRYIEGKGCKVPKGYNPPVHWNELYDNEYFPNVCGLCDDFILNPKTKRGFVPGFYAKNKELLDKFYSLDLMKAEAAKAKELGCEALYLDPGWDTGPSHPIWDADRLGSMESFVKLMREDYGLKVSLWASVAGVPPTVGDPTILPLRGARRQQGRQTGRYSRVLVVARVPGHEIETAARTLQEWSGVHDVRQRPVFRSLLRQDPRPLGPVDARGTRPGVVGTDAAGQEEISERAHRDARSHHRAGRASTTRRPTSALPVRIPSIACGATSSCGTRWTIFSRGGASACTTTTWPTAFRSICTST